GQPAGERETFASLRRPSYSGRLEFKKVEDVWSEEKVKLEELREISGKMGTIRSSGPAFDSAILGGTGTGGVDETKLRMLADRWGSLSERERAQLLAELKRDLPARHRAVLDDYFKALSSAKEATENAWKHAENPPKTLQPG